MKRTRIPIKQEQLELCKCTGTDYCDLCSPEVWIPSLYVGGCPECASTCNHPSQRVRHLHMDEDGNVRAVEGGVRVNPRPRLWRIAPLG